MQFSEHLILAVAIVAVLLALFFVLMPEKERLLGNIQTFNEHFLKAHLTLSEKRYEGIELALGDLQICLHEGYFENDIRLAIMFLREALGYHREILEEPSGPREKFHFFSRHMSFMDALGALCETNRKLREKDESLGWIPDPESDDLVG